jgi:hypothetical protein
MEQLWRLQRQRKGENAAELLNVNLCRRAQASLRNKAKKLFEFRGWLRTRSLEVRDLHRSVDWLLAGEGKWLSPASGRAFRGLLPAGMRGLTEQSESTELCLHAGTRQGGDWGGDPASDQSGVWEEY